MASNKVFPADNDNEAYQFLSGMPHPLLLPCTVDESRIGNSKMAKIGDVPSVILCSKSGTSAKVQNEQSDDPDIAKPDASASRGR